MTVAKTHHQTPCGCRHCCSSRQILDAASRVQVYRVYTVVPWCLWPRIIQAAQCSNAPDQGGRWYLSLISSGQRKRVFG